MSDEHVVLVGLMGTGKTTVGRLVASRTGRPFVDADDEIVARAGRTIPEIFATDGEDAFRQIEADVFDDLLTRTAPSVIAAGGGAVLDEAIRRGLRERATVIWLQASPAELEARLGAGTGRPLLQADGDVAATIARLEGERAPLYAEVAHGVVDVDRAAPSAVADRVIVTIDELAEVQP